MSSYNDIPLNVIKATPVETWQDYHWNCNHWHFARYALDMHSHPEEMMLLEEGRLHQDNKPLWCAVDCSLITKWGHIALALYSADEHVPYV